MWSNLWGSKSRIRDTHVCRLKKALYGLKQAPRAWYKRIDSYMLKLGFTRSNVDLNIYFKVDKEKPLILVMYVDDLFLTSATHSFISARGSSLLSSR